MGIVVSSGEDYKQIMIKLSPTGACWPIEDDSNWVTLLEALAQEYARVDAAAYELVQEAFPDTSTVLLPNWERVLGLPDECSTPGASIDVRRADVLAKLRARGGQSAAYIESVIAAYGAQAVVQDMVPFYADEGEAGEHVFDTIWDYKFLIDVQNPSTIEDVDSFECRMNQITPAYAQSFFVYD